MKPKSRKLDHAQKFKTNMTYCIHHRADIHIINYCKMELISLAENRFRGLIFIETQNLDTITQISSRFSNSVATKIICSIPHLQSFGRITKEKILTLVTKQKKNFMDGQPNGIKNLKLKKLHLRFMTEDGTSLDHHSPH
jgi:hypothetical protein